MSLGQREILWLAVAILVIALLMLWVWHRGRG